MRLLQVTAAHSNGGTSALDGVEATGTLDGRCMAAAGVDLDRISVPGWPGPGGAYQPADQQEADRSAPEAPARAGDGEDEVNTAAVAAYRASLESGTPLSERKLAAMFGKTSRRWARNRIAEAHRVPVSAMAEP